MQADISFVLATYRRDEALRRTLTRVAESTPRSVRFELIVVDNADSEETAALVAQFSWARRIAVRQNAGSTAKALGAHDAAAPILMFLDDDSAPRAGCVERMLAVFERHPDLSYAGCTVHLPNGAQECSALPHVFVGCGVGLRAATLRQVGGLDASFFMQAEEYDLAFRLSAAGWGGTVFADLQVDHEKTPDARSSERRTFCDVRNNLRVIDRYLPEPHRTRYAEDALLRYRALADHNGFGDAALRASSEGARIGTQERPAYARWRLSAALIERFFEIQRISARLRDLAAGSVRRVLLAGPGKNIFAFYEACRAANILPVAVADDVLAARVAAYRDVPAVPVAAAANRRDFDAVVIANTSYVHAPHFASDWRRRVQCPVLHFAQFPDSTVAYRPAAENLDIPFYPRPAEGAAEAVAAALR